MCSVGEVMSTLQPTNMRSHDRKSNPVRVTLFLGETADSRKIAMVAYEDGTYDILCDGVSNNPQPWRADDLDGCIDAYLRIMRSQRPN